MQTDEWVRRLQVLNDAMRTAPRVVAPSQYWRNLNDLNSRQLSTFGYDNFKQTLALNYFTWLVSFGDAQFDFLLQHIPKARVNELQDLSRTIGTYSILGPEGSLHYNLLTLLIWEYLDQMGLGPQFDHLSEPLEGTPPAIERRGRLVSQDLANSILEYKSIMDAIGETSQITTVCEMGAGYGRTAYVFLKLLPALKYIIVDIPPALAVSERYLSNQFPGRKIFRFESGMDARSPAIRGAIQDSDLVFLLPTHLDAIADGSIDLFLNISSLHEMRPEQISFYLDWIERITRGYVYIKQWKSFDNTFDGVRITETDYPIPTNWTRVFWRDCRIQTSFFECLHKTPLVLRDAAAAVEENFLLTKVERIKR